MKKFIKILKTPYKLIVFTLIVVVVVAIIGWTPDNPENPVSDEAHAIDDCRMGIREDKNFSYKCGESIDIMAYCNSDSHWNYVGIYKSGSSTSERWYWTRASKWIPHNSNTAQSWSFNGVWVDVRGYKGASSSSITTNKEQSSRFIGTGDFKIKMFWSNDGSTFYQTAQGDINISISHDYTVDSGVQYTAATCTAKRKNYKQCVCGYNPMSASHVVEVGNTLNHDYKSSDITGYIKYTCSKCGDSYNVAKKVRVTFYRNTSTSDSTTATQEFTYNVNGQSFSNKGWDSAKTGYTLSGWSDSSTATSAQYGKNSGVSNDWINKKYPSTKVYAVWTPNTYTVSYNANGGTGTTASSSHTYGTAKSLTANGFSRTDYRFAGWNTKADGTGTNYSDKQSVSNLTATNGGTVTLYAKWVPIFYYDLNFYINGTSISDANIATADVHINGTRVSDDAADYWKQHDKGTTFKVDDVKVNSAYTKYAESNMSGTINQKSETAIYIGSNYNITYNANDGTGSNVTQKVNYGTAWTSKPNTTFTRTGHTLTSWNTATNGSGTKYDVNAKQTNKQGANVTLYAQWTPNTYTVNYDGNGATSGTTGSSTHTYGVSKALTANGFDRTGYSFAGWNTQSDGSGNAFVDSASVSNLTANNNGSVTLYAQWTANPYTVEIQHWAWGWKNGEGTDETDGTKYLLEKTYKSVDYGDEISFSEADAVTIPKGFYINALQANVFSENEEWVEYQFPYTRPQLPYDYSVEYGYFPETYRVTYKINDEIISNLNPETYPETYNVLYGFKLPDLDERLGYAFGWYLGDEKVTGINQDELSFDSAESLYDALKERKTGDITLDAKWTPNTYTVRYDANGGTGNMSDSSHTYDADKALTAISFTKKNMTFVGWNTERDGSGTSYADQAIVKNLTDVADATVTLYAQWKEYDCTITAIASIDSSTVNLAHGTPTSVFCLEDEKGNVYYKAVDYTESGQVVFDKLPPGKYTLSQQKTYRYVLEGIPIATIANGSLNGNAVVFELTAENNVGSATFVNKVSTFSWFGHNFLKLLGGNV